MTQCATFEQAAAASAFTGQDIFALVDDRDDFANDATGADSRNLIVTQALVQELNQVKLQADHHSTLLRDSGMFGFVSNLLKEATTFAFPELDDKNDPRETTARIGNYMHVDNPDEVARFIARNSDISALLEKTVQRTTKTPGFNKGVVSIFSKPEEDDYCVYIDADFAVESYEEAYALENQVFSETLEPHFDRLNFRIVLSFDTDSDD